MNHKIFKKYLNPLLVLILIFFLVSCNDKKDTSRTKSPAKAVQAVEKTTAVAVRKKDGNDTYISYVYENLKNNIKKENYEDPASFDMPRIQFTGWYPDEAEKRTIWSVKIDGTDLRQVMDEKEIFGNGYGTLNDTPVRSPNNRYIAFPLGSGDKVVFDLKTRKRFVVGKAPWFPNMAWRPNNKLVFDGNGLFEYDPVTRVKKTVNEDKLDKNIVYHAFRINQRTGDIYITGRDRGKKQDMVSILNPDWSLKKEYFLSAAMNVFFISPDGKKMISYNGKKYIFDFTKNQKIRAFKEISDLPFTPDSKGYFFNLNSKGYLTINDFENDKEDIICHIPFAYNKLSLINYKGDR